MATWVAFLRAVNVGWRTVKMVRLRGIFSALGLRNVKTYIQTGNVFFESDGDCEELTANIEKALEQELGFAVDAMVRKLEELQKLIESRPFQAVSVGEDSRACILFCSAPLPTELPAPTEAYEVVGVEGRDLFVVVKIVNGRFPNAAAMLEKKLGLMTTARFFHTLEKMVNQGS